MNWIMRAVRVVLFGVLTALGSSLLLGVMSFVPGHPTTGFAANLLHSLELSIGVFATAWIVWYLVALVTEHDMPYSNVLHSLTVGACGFLGYLALVTLNRTTTVWDLSLTLGVCAIVAEYVRDRNTEPEAPTAPKRAPVR
jgi:hypothetical protein